MGKNRTMEAKRIKHIRQSKARPRHLRMNKGYMKVSYSDDKNASARIPDECRALFEYRNRAKSFIDDYLTAKYGIHRDIENEILAGPYSPVPNSVERDKVHATDLLVGKFTTLTMLSTSRLDCIEFVEYQRLPGIVRKSITYSSHERAMQVFQLKTIRWKETIRIPNVE